MTNRGGARAGAGRKATRAAKRTFKLSSQALERIDAISEEDGISKVEVIERAIGLLARNRPQAGAGRDAEALAERVEREMARLSPRLPGIDRGDLALILQSLLRPPGSGRRFILRQAGSGHVL